MISSKVEYLLLTLTELAMNPTEAYVSSAAVAERGGIPPKYMPRLMALLSKKGWVASLRGARGGVRLVADPGAVTIRDVMDVAGEPLFVKPCVNGQHSCSQKQRCVLHTVWMDAQAKVDEIMEGTTIADLVAAELEHEGGRPNAD